MFGYGKRVLKGNQGMSLEGKAYTAGPGDHHLLAVRSSPHERYI